MQCCTTLPPVSTNTTRVDLSSNYALLQFHNAFMPFSLPNCTKARRKFSWLIIIQNYVDIHDRKLIKDIGFIGEKHILCPSFNFTKFNFFATLFMSCVVLKTPQELFYSSLSRFQSRILFTQHCHYYSIIRYANVLFLLPLNMCEQFPKD